MYKTAKRIMGIVLAAALTISFMEPAISFAAGTPNPPTVVENESSLVEMFSVDLESIPAVEYSSLACNVADETGAALEGVSVVVYSSDGTTVLAQGETDASGLWESSPESIIVGNTYVVSFSKADYVFSINDIEWVAQIDSEILTVTGTQLLPVCREDDYTYTVNPTKETTEIIGYSGSDVAITIPAELGGYPVTRIGNDAFQAHNCLVKVQLPEHLTSIGERVFDACEALTEISFPEGLTEIGAYAFRDCTSLKTVKLPDSVQTIGGGAFRNCKTLTSINYPLNWSTAGSGIFSGCTSLTSITIPEGVTAIPADAFYVSSLQQVVFPSTLIAIKDRAFRQCLNLTEITLPDGLTEIAAYAFDECTNLKTVKLPDSVKTIGGGAFRDCKNLTSINYPLNWSTAGSGIFSGCTSLTSITIPEGVTTIPADAFYVSSLQQVVFPSTLIAIKDRAFRQCPKLTEITLPDGLTEIAAYAFDECTNLKTVKLPDSVQTIGGGAFRNCKTLTSINYPLNWSTAGSGIFSGCTSLTSITIPEGVTTIPADAFYISSLQQVVFPSTLIAIKDRAFRQCPNLTEITLPDGLTEIATYAFDECTNLKTVKLPDSVQTIGGSAFKDCKTLSSINYPQNWTSAGTGVFSGCTSLTSITIPEGVTSIPADAFSSSSLQQVNFPSTLSSIKRGAFERCTGLTEIKLPDGLKEIGSRAFEDCDSLKQVILPSNIESVSSHAFSSCDKLGYVLYEGENFVISNTAFTLCENACLYCLPPVAYWAFENNIPCVVLELDEAAYSDYALDMDVSQFYSTSETPQMNHYIPFTLEYTIKADLADQVQDPAFVIMFTRNMEVNLRSITLDDVLLEEYSYNDKDNSLTIPIKNLSGTLRVAATPIDGGSVAAHAALSYKQNNTTKTEWINCVTFAVPTLDISAPSSTSNTSFTVSGITEGKRAIQLMIGETVVGSVTAKKDGTYSAKISFPETPVVGESYVVKAVWTDVPSVAAQCVVRYEDQVMEVVQFDMYYSAHTIKKLDLLAAMGSRICTAIYPGHEMEFHIKLKNADSVGDVYVISTKGGISKQMKAEPTGEDGCYIASGYFDESDKRYIPGKITLGYTEKVETEELMSIPEEAELAEELQDAEVTVIEDSEETYHAEIAFTNGEKLDCYQTSMNITEAWHQYYPNTQAPAGSDSDIAAAFFSGLSASYPDVCTPAENNAAVFRTDNLFTYLIWDPAKNEVLSSTINVAIGTAGIYALNDGVFTLAQSKAIWDFASESAAVDLVVSGFGNMFSVGMAELEVMYSKTLTDYQKAEALEAIRKTQNAYVALWTYKIAAACATGMATAMNPVAGFLVGYLTDMAVQVVDDYLQDSLRYYAAGGQAVSCKWIIDPSGYVYDINTNARLDGVTTTAYWIPCDEPDETYWNSVPDPDEYGEVWDACEYSQENPLITGSDGRYAWDVPEGWWRVKYEKAGYETTWSDWMTVLPVQTDVNIGMTPLDLPAYSFHLLSSQDDTISVAVTNTTDKSISVLYLLAAYDSLGRIVEMELTSTELTAGVPVPLTLELEQTHTAETVKAFLLDAFYASLCDFWTCSSSS